MRFRFARSRLSHVTSPTSHPSVLVTGGTGFLGRRIVERLLGDRRNVTVLARKPAPDLEQRGVRFISASLDDADAIRSACAGIETVFHTAAKVGVWGRYDDFFRTNVLGTRALLAGCREHGVQRLVYTSTPSVVYNGLDLADADESLPLTTNCPSSYPLTKAIAEREVLAANRAELRTIALRPHLIWGSVIPISFRGCWHAPKRAGCGSLGAGRTASTWSTSRTPLTPTSSPKKHFLSLNRQLSTLNRHCRPPPAKPTSSRTENQCRSGAGSTSCSWRSTSHP